MGGEKGYEKKEFERLWSKRDRTGEWQHSVVAEVELGGGGGRDITLDHQGGSGGLELQPRAACFLKIPLWYMSGPRCLDLLVRLL